jgi:hypothetical protein
MGLDWLDWSNPVAVWWSFLLTVSAVNITLLLALHRHSRRTALERGALRIELMLLLCAAYVFGCAFRSVLPRADVQRICLFDTWLSSIMVGRSVATVAEVCFAIQWAIVLGQLSRIAHSDLGRNISGLIVPLIALAEVCSWYAVITTSYLGNAVENSLWAVTFLLIAIALVRLVGEFHGVIRIAMTTTLAGIAGYLAFLVLIDVPMYFDRWQADLANGKTLLGLVAGLHDVSTRWVVTHDIVRWHEELAWMALYFSAAVWSSLGLCSFILIQHRIHRYHVGSARAAAAGRPLSGSVPAHARRTAG